MKKGVRSSINISLSTALYFFDINFFDISCMISLELHSNLILTCDCNGDDVDRVDGVDGVDRVNGHCRRCV